MKKIVLRMLVVGAIAGAITLVAPAAYAQSAPSVDPEIAAVLQAVPGGTVVDADHAVWPALGMEMTAADAVSPLSVGSCATGSVCAFSGLNGSGSKLSWTTCGTFTISAFTVRSIADARSTGYLQARNGSTVVATAYVGASANVYATVTNVRCVS
jgi:hypothetical protein